MPTQISFGNIPFKALHDSSTWNLHPFLDDFIPDTLEKSIAKVGILHPPVVIQTGVEIYDIVGGRKRIQCWQKLGKSHFHCHILSPASPKNTILSFLLEDQISGNCPLSIPEMAHYVKLCLDYMGKKEAFEKLSRDNLPRMDSLKLLCLLELDYAIQRRIHFGQLSDKIIYDLLKLNPEDRSRMVDLIERLQLGGGKQKRLVSLCRDITLRENTSIGTLLDQLEMKKVIEHNEMNIPQKTNRLLSLLQKRCYPQSTAAREIFQSQLQALDLPGTCEICPSPYFEKDEVTLSLRFPDFEACRRILPSLKGLLQQNQQGPTISSHS